jgi:hypothetical protein
MKHIVPVAFACASTIVNPNLVRGDGTRSNITELPTYSYAIQSGAYEDAGLFMDQVHIRIPNTLWLCDIRYARTYSMVLECSAARTIDSQTSTSTFASNETARIATRISCANADSSEQTVFLSTLDPSLYARVSIMCRRSLYDDGF